ncbi:hypothetical protein F8M41_017103 [Gigaspora margarita]|uniref:Uncharacterized protein n=1 Tax=Gigaspora margarita TaxID=4874 RepID=A0A8H4EMC3_GIGMA|nr:hypothetical protein F8M41_017103 [Gigaspora margarita]
MNEDYKDYDFCLRIGLDGSPSLVNDFAYIFGGKLYNETLHTHVITTNVHLDNYIINIELLKTGWYLRPNINYYSYIDGAILVCDLSRSDILKEIKELSDEYNNEYGNYVADKMPIMIVVDKNGQKGRNDILKEVKTYVEDVLLFDKTLTKENENTIEILKEFIELVNK